MRNSIVLLLVCFLGSQFLLSQEITTHQYRRVEPENMQEYIKRETTYWAKFAENEVKKGNMTFWGIFQKMGGMDQDTGPNILIINEFKDLDKGADWGSIADLFPDVKMEDIQTWDISTNTDNVYLRDLNNHISTPGVVPNDDFKFVRFIYHNTKNTGAHLSFEAQKWKPLVEKAMKEGKTSLKGWGNAIVISPESPDFPYSSFSYDLFTTAHEALLPAFGEDLEIPEGFFDGLTENYEGPRHSNLYRIIAVVTPTGE